jgi:hypothetical protein
MIGFNVCASVTSEEACAPFALHSVGVRVEASALRSVVS